MWRILSVLTIISAIWAAGTLLPTTDEEGHLAAVVAIATQGTPGTDDAANAIAPIATDFTPAASAGSGAAEPASWAATVAQATPAALAAGPGAPEPALDDEASRIRLVMALQHELRRVGCFDGRVSGAWTRATRRAVAAFADRLNLDRSSGSPDPVMLMLLEKSDNRVCRAPCIAGQAPDRDGRCKPAETIARLQLPAPVPVVAEAAPPGSEQANPPTAEGPIVLASIAAAAPAQITAADLVEPDQPAVATTKSRKTKLGKAQKQSPDAYAPEGGTVIATATAGSKRKVQVASIDNNGWSPSVTIVQKTSRKKLKAPTYGLGVTFKRPRATVQPRVVRQRTARRIGAAAAYRNFIRGNNGGSLR